MGGNALQNVRRHDADEYFTKITELNETLGVLFGDDARLYNLEAYSTKPSFGDADILATNLPPNYKELLIVCFGLDKDMHVSNGNVFSFNYEGLQVDLINTPEEEFESSKFYFDYNDFGNLLGKITRKLGMKFGHDGLFLRVYDPNLDTVLGPDILLTRDPQTILNMLGLSYTRYLLGFETLEDIFVYVSGCQYFNPGIYLLDNLSNKAMVRDHKRKTYNAFIEWVDARKDQLYAYPYEDLVNKGGYRLKEPFYSDIIIKYFPEVEGKVNSLIRKYEENLKIKEVFNGNIVMELLKIEGKELGEFMRYVNSYDITRNVILSAYSHPNLIENFIKKMYQLFLTRKET